MHNRSTRSVSRRIAHLAALASVAVLGAGALSAGAQKPYKVESKWKVSGDGTSWDYLVFDAPTHRLFVSHQTEVNVLDTTSGKELGAIKNLGRAHGTVLLDAHTGFISDGTKNRIVVFDPSSYQMTGEIPTGANPDGMAYEPVTKTLWCFNGNGKNATVVDVASKKVVATVPMPGKPEFPQAPGNGFVYVNVEDTNSILKIDAKASKIVQTIALKGCEAPSGMALDKAGMRVFSVCDGNKGAVVDLKTGKQIGNPSIGDGPDAAGYDPSTKMFFASSDDGMLAVVDGSKPSFPTVQMLKTQLGARTMTLDPTTGTIYTATAAPGKKQPGAKRPDALPGTFVVLVLTH